METHMDVYVISYVSEIKVIIMIRIMMIII